MTERQQSSENSANAENAPQQKVCEKCGAKFDCYSSSGTCWCEDVILKPEALANLRAQYNDCLCPECLSSAVITIRTTP